MLWRADEVAGSGDGGGQVLLQDSEGCGADGGSGTWRRCEPPRQMVLYHICERWSGCRCERLCLYFARDLGAVRGESRPCDRRVVQWCTPWRRQVSAHFSLVLNEAWSCAYERPAVAHLRGNGRQGQHRVRREERQHLCRSG